MSNTCCISCQRHVRTALTHQLTRIKKSANGNACATLSCYAKVMLCSEQNPIQQQTSLMLRTTEDFTDITPRSSWKCS